jgi:integrase
VKRTLRKRPTGQWEYGETKRAESRRIVRLQNWILAKLKDLKQCQTENPVVAPEDWPEAVDLIFVKEFGRPVNVNSLVYKHFKPILKRAGLPDIRLYDLRHTAATLALTVGVSPKVVSEQLGHTSAAFTLDVYSHVLQDDAAAIGNVVICVSTFVPQLAALKPKQRVKMQKPNQKACGGLRS